MHTSNLIAYAVPVFTFMILCEFIYGYFRNKNNYRLNDTFTSLSLGMISRFPSYLRLGVQGLVYAWIYQSFNFGILDSYDSYVWVIAFVLYDLSYYWLHRCHHEIKILWASHVVHHHGEEFNLSTALRQTSTGFLWKWVFFLPMFIIGIPPHIYVSVAGLNLVYQFWVHTEHIGRLGFLEYIFVTPSNHRVHHAQNEDYLDANYGGVFILWDRLFGTFIDERTDLKPVYGTVKPLKSFNPFWANIEVFYQMIFDSYHTAKWSDKIKVWFSPPSWRPDDVSSLYPIQKNDLSSFEKYDPEISLREKIFTGTQFAVINIMTVIMLFNVQNYLYSEIIAIVLLVVSSSITNSFILDGKRFGYKAELLKSIAVLACLNLGYFSSSMSFFVMCYALFTLLVSTFILLSRDKNIISPV
jgi:alkylglycerol monooxygenase